MRPDWLYYGTLFQAGPGRGQTKKLAQALPGAKRLYDINLRRDSYTPQLIAELLPAANVVKLNEDEVVAIDSRNESLRDFTEFWSRNVGWSAVAVTRGARGCAIRIGDDYAEVPGYKVKVADTVGAGDAFAAAFLHGLAQGWNAHGCGDFANRVGAVVASRPGGVPSWSLEDFAAGERR
ncbi:PfkB domain protein (fragment) [Candidatus Sulfopaludibacter sp. SbA3]